jgi:hypothetical protein
VRSYVPIQIITHSIRFFFHFSGHGGRVKDANGDEDDGYDETIYPVDHDRYQGESGQIVDDVSRNIYTQRSPNGTV